MWLRGLWVDVLCGSGAMWLRGLFLFAIRLRVVGMHIHEVQLYLTIALAFMRLDFRHSLLDDIMRQLVPASNTPISQPHVHPSTFVQASYIRTLNNKLPALPRMRVIMLVMMLVM